MPVTNLNKIISLFLGGAFSAILLALIGLLNLHLPKTFSLSHSVLSVLSSGWVVTAVTAILFPAFAFVGLLSDSLANLILTRPVAALSARLTARRAQLITKIFGAGEVAADHRILRGRCLLLLGENDRYGPLLSGEAVPLHHIAVALLFQAGSKEAIAWTTEHYAVHLLAASYFVQLCISSPFLLMSPLSPENRAVLLTSLVVVAYLLVRWTLERHLYAYNTVYRFVCVYLREHPGAADASTA